MTIAAVFILLLAAAPPLSDTQRTQLDAAVDRGYLDEPALYPLLENALTWPNEDEAGSTVPDYVALYQHPSDQRGNVFLIEGDLLRTRRLELTQPGDWGDAVTELAIQIPGQDEAVVVLLADPQNRWSINTRSQPVRVAARFYKIWSDTDQLDQATKYLVFVGRTPKLEAWASKEAVTPGPSLMVPLMLLVLLFFLWFYLRRTTRARMAVMRTRQLAHSAQLSDELLEENEQHPTDPADALAEMDNRRQRGDVSN